MAAGQVFFERHTIAFLKPPALGGDRSYAIDTADVFVAHNARRAIGLVRMPVAAADAGGLHLEDAGIGWDFRKGVLADLGFEGAESGGS